MEISLSLISLAGVIDCRPIPDFPDSLVVEVENFLQSLVLTRPRHQGQKWEWPYIPAFIDAFIRLFSPSFLLFTPWLTPGDSLISLPMIIAYTCDMVPPGCFVFGILSFIPAV